MRAAGIALFISLVCGATACVKPAADDVDPADPRIEVGGGTVDVVLGPGLKLERAVVLRWVRRAAVAVAGYYGRFPVAHVVIEVKPGGDEPVNGGVTYAAREIDVRISNDAKAADLDSDWVLTHEMFHLAFPNLDEKYLWMMEGLADYLEPIARARAGQWTAEEVWRDFAEGSPRGEPRRGDRGLDHSSSRDRIYWGGNTYWLLADLRIRERTDNKKSVDDAVRAILEAGGDGNSHWEIENVLATGDRATGTEVLTELHAQFGEKPGRVDLAALWKRLGVVYAGGAVRFDDAAPLAAIRKSITAPSAR
jgi:hypothetical protein